MAAEVSKLERMFWLTLLGGMVLAMVGAVLYYATDGVQAVEELLQ